MKIKNLKLIPSKFITIFFLLALSTEIVPIQKNDKFKDSYGSQAKVIGRHEKVEVIGQYSSWIQSMCSQSCHGAMVGNFNILDKINNIPEFSQNISVFIQGQWVTVEELPTIAGPGPSKMDRNKKIKSKKIEVKTHKEINFVSYRMDAKNKENYNNKKSYEINLVISNPLSKNLDLLISLNKLNPKRISLKPNEIKSIPYKFQFKDYQEANFLVTDVKFNHKKHEADKAFKGIHVYHRSWPKLEELAK